MAIHTPLPFEDADRIVRAHGLGAAREVHGILAGSVNSNFFVAADARRVFVRIYEEQGVEGVEYEWALLDHLAAVGLPVPLRVPGPSPGELCVDGKPTAVFETMGGEEVCQAMVDPSRARAVGTIIARAHAAAEGFALRRGGRFEREDVRRRLEEVVALDRPELREATGVLLDALDALGALDGALPRGVIHGDLFRDNVRWDGDRVVGILDWESASDGELVYDLAVAILAWCYGDGLDLRLVAALREGYESLRPLEPREVAQLGAALRGAAVRFAVTRITDYHLRNAEQVRMKDWRRFYDRLHAVATL